MKELILYFSRADYNICIEQAKKDLQSSARPEVVAMLEDMSQYDLVTVMYPNYWGTMPMQGGNIGFEECNRMVDAFMEAGFIYFDTAKGYLGGLSEGVCPQHLEIRKLLADVAKEFDI